MSKKSEKIIDTAARLFIQNGVKKTTMDEIAQTANVSKVTIYKYFGDKDGLYFSLGKNIYDKYAQSLSDAQKTDASIYDKVAKFMEIISEFILSNKMTLCEELARLNYGLEDVKADFDAQYNDILLKLIAQGKNAGMIKAGAADEHIFHYIDMGISYFQNNTDYRNKMANDETFKDEFMGFLLSNIFI